MGYLILAVAFQVLMSLWLKWGETRNQDRMMVMWVNYGVATLLSIGFWIAQGAPEPQLITWWLGLLGGISYTVSLLLWMIAISTSGLGIATSSMRLSVVWPTLASVLLFSELPTLYQMVGIGLAFGVLGLLAVHAMRPRLDNLSGSALIPLLLLFLFHGAVGLTQKFFTEWGQPDQKLTLLVIIFSSSLIFSGIFVWLKKSPFTKGDLLRGSVFGAGNILTNFLLLMGLSQVPGVIAFPFSNISVILLASLAGWAIWKEKLGRLGLLVIFMSAIAIVLMTLEQ